ncbi:GCN5 family acetyltransferase [Chryseobacterium angstadtii]|uniref:GCN5 family acetyltransferase n=1 Tax=Chryseobacterium angstadtii TaxID=558151 RepID=A0A0J7KM53_9FLAO|nr:GNAT family N-acetyltransferase [Chryseobacterium angstadtii]KMQ58405.1 GCN5 family acetyltransferase [Chryseobacterium angstadtii]
MNPFTFEKTATGSAIPYDLLLLADETREAIDRYIFNSEIYQLYDDTRAIAVIALHPNSTTELEIKNMAVVENYRNRGIGSILIDKAKAIAQQNGFTMLVVGTSDTGFQQLRFYEKNGFAKKGMRKDFFIENYPLPIYENGLQMRDMIVLAHDLSE